MELKEKSKTYAKGAIVGAVIGMVFAAATHRRLLLWGGIGLLAGGFITHKFSEDKITDESAPVFKKAE